MDERMDGWMMDGWKEKKHLRREDRIHDQTNPCSHQNLSIGQHCSPPSLNSVPTHLIDRYRTTDPHSALSFSMGDTEDPFYSGVLTCSTNEYSGEMFLMRD